MRTQEEIITRFESADDFLGVQRADLIDYMTFENARPHLKEEYVARVDAGDEQWSIKKDPKKEIIEYLPFAYEKAEGQRGLSAARSMLHFKTWIWLDDADFYNQIILEIEDYHNYGIDVLDKISEHYGFER